MKHVIAALFIHTLFYTCNAQIIANDSAETGVDNKLTTFYSLPTGQRVVVNYAVWNLAITVRPTQFPDAPLGGTTIRINEAFGTTAYYVPNTNAAGFAALDTTGYKSWTKLHDSDASIDEGALNSNRSLTNIYDFGWGTYNASSHDVVGDSLYLIQLPNGELKKFIVVNLDRDTAFNIKYSNIDNSDLQNLHISKKAYLGKEFVYLNLANNTVEDKEPFAPDWDLQFLKYSATDVISGNNIPIVGVWLNKGDSAIMRSNHDVLDNDLTGLAFSGKLNAIGWNWKYPGSFLAMLSGKNIFESPEFYRAEDSLAYFVKVKSDDIYKIVFTKYNNNNGRIYFYKEKLNSATGIEEVIGQSTVSVFPNPASSVLNILIPSSAATLRVLDMSGRLLTETTATENLVQLNTSDFTPGVYLLQTILKGKSSVTKFIVNR